MSETGSNIGTGAGKPDIRVVGISISFPPFISVVASAFYFKNLVSFCRTYLFLVGHYLFQFDFLGFPGIVIWSNFTFPMVLVGESLVSSCPVVNS